METTQHPYAASMIAAPLAGLAILIASPARAALTWRGWSLHDVRSGGQHVQEDVLITWVDSRSGRPEIYFNRGKNLAANPATLAARAKYVGRPKRGE